MTRIMFPLIQVEFVVTSYQINSHLPGTPSPRNLLGNLSGMLINSHPAIDYPRLLPPSFLEIGGFHIAGPKPLPVDLANFVNDPRSNGTVLFAMGTTFDMRFVPHEVMASYLAAFASIPYNVIMVVKGDISEHKVPHNVKIVGWAPQVDILADARTVVFISHCGLNSIMEAVSHSVPIVGIPVFADQDDNLRRLLDRRLAVGVTKHCTSEELVAAILEVVTNPV